MGMTLINTEINVGENIDRKTVTHFGDQWALFDQTALSPVELQDIFESYFHIFPWHCLPHDAVGFDMGCGSGRWANHVAPKVHRLYCFDAAQAAVRVAKKALRHHRNCDVALASIDHIPLPDESMDFGYSLGVLHYIPDPVAGLRSCVAKLKPGAPFLIYVYYRFDNKPSWFYSIWRLADFLRKLISRQSFQTRVWISTLIALTVYFPLARLARALESLGLDVESIPLSAYRQRSIYTMRTDALDRFGARLEHRFTAAEVKQIMQESGLVNVEISQTMPYWCALGFKPCREQ